MNNKIKFFYVYLDENHKYFYSHVLKNNVSSFHQHKFYEFVHIIDGEMYNYIDDKKYLLSKNDFLLIMPGELHSATAKNSCSHRDICIPTNLFENICNSIDENLLSYLKNNLDSRHFSPPINLLPSFFQKLSDLSLKGNYNDLGTKMLVSSMVNELLFSMLPQTPSDEFLGAPEWFIKIKRRFQNIEHIRGGITSLIKDINYNQTYINRVFKKYMGMSIGAYLNETRLKFAITYLKTSVLSVNDISDLLGFSSPSFFYKKFQEKYDVTPNYFRTNTIKQKDIKL